MGAQGMGNVSGFYFDDQHHHTGEAGHVCPTALGRPATSSMLSTQPS
eukprot:COSAG03_NODE_1753_length_3569_cov_2.545821_2_plen_47_part_00